MEFNNAQRGSKFGAGSVLNKKYELQNTLECFLERINTNTEVSRYDKRLMLEAVRKVASALDDFETLITILGKVD
jgi:hypothetical protein